jgi:hypothetical protein
MECDMPNIELLSLASDLRARAEETLPRAANMHDAEAQEMMAQSRRAIRNWHYGSNNLSYRSNGEAAVNVAAARRLDKVPLR